MRSEGLTDGRGAGGRLRRPSARKARSTPYERPSTTAGSGPSLISKIVNPAYRLIAGGAARLLPSVFSSSSTDSLPLAVPTEEGLEQGTRSENQESSNHLRMSESTALEVPCEQDKSHHQAADLDLSNIEQLIKGKTFCREEIDHLMSILQSRIVSPEGRGVTSKVGTAEQADMVDIHHGNLKSENEENQENLEEDRLANQTPLQQPTLTQANKETRVSPIELAKAYMGSRASEFETGSISQVSKNDRLLFSHTYEMTSNRSLPPPSPKPSICWPGAVLQEHNAYLTPYSQRGRSGHTNHPRTPYSRTIYSRSKSKLNPLDADNRNLSPTSATPSQKKTPLYGEGSVGPVRRLRHKFVSDTARKSSPSVWSSQKAATQLNESFSGDYSLDMKSNEPITDIGTSEAGKAAVHPQSSKLARQILEQISRTPTPKEKSDELKLVIAKKNYSGSDVSPTATTSYVGGLRGDKEKESPFFKVPFPNLPTGGTDSGVTSASKTTQKSSFSVLDDIPSTIHQVATQATEIRREREPSGNKPILAPISVDKSNQRVRFASENNIQSSGFTFPVAAAAAPLSEPPPTPSLLPFSSPIKYVFEHKKSLAFSFPHLTSNAPTMDDAPVFKFGSQSARLSFSSIGQDAVCC